MIKQYETVFIATPVLSEAQMKEAVAKYTKLILIEFKADPTFVATLETQYHRDERILRYITVALDKHAVAYAEHRRQTRAAKAAAPKAAEETAAPAVPAAEETAPAAENQNETVEA